MEVKAATDCTQRGDGEEEAGKQRDIHRHMDISDSQESQQEARDQRKHWPHHCGTVHQLSDSLHKGSLVLEPPGSLLACVQHCFGRLGIHLVHQLLVFSV